MPDKNAPTTREDAIKYGQESAKENVSKEDQAVRERNEANREATFADARESAQLNHDADAERQDDAIQNGIPANDTTKKAKQAVAKSQLDPNGEDPISAKEVNESATDASMETGNKTSVSNKDVAERAQNPGEAEENAPRSTANPDIKSGQNATSEKVSEASTTNRDQAREGEEAAGRPTFNQSEADKDS